MCIIKITVCGSTTHVPSITHYAIQQIKEVHRATSQNVKATKTKKIIIITGVYQPSSLIQIILQPRSASGRV